MSEFRDPTTYNGISQKSFVAPTKLTAYLKILPDMGLVEREYPALTSTKMQGNAARGLDKISDRFLKFWSPFFFEFASDALEACCKEYLVRRNFDGQLPFFASSIGRWWHKTKKLTLWQLTPSRKTCWSVLKTLQDLDAKCSMLPLAADAAVHRYLFSRTAFEKPLLEVEKTDQKLHLVTIDALLR